MGGGKFVSSACSDSGMIADDTCLEQGFDWPMMSMSSPHHAATSRRPCKSSPSPMGSGKFVSSPCSVSWMIAEDTCLEQRFD